MRFRPGESGNPSGKVRGTRNRVTMAAEALLAGETEALTRKAIDLALAGDTVACGSASIASCRHARAGQCGSPCRSWRRLPICRV